MAGKLSAAAATPSPTSSRPGTRLDLLTPSACTKSITTSAPETARREYHWHIEVAETCPPYWRHAGIYDGRKAPPVRRANSKIVSGVHGWPARMPSRRGGPYAVRRRGHRRRARNSRMPHRGARLKCICRTRVQTGTVCVVVVEVGRSEVGLDQATTRAAWNLFTGYVTSK